MSASPVGRAESATVHTVIDSPLGELTLVARDETLVGLYFPQHWYRPDPQTFGPRVDGGFEQVRQQLDEYLAGRRPRFELCTDAAGDDFQRRVWGLLAEIPYGTTTSSRQLAARLGHPT